MRYSVVLFITERFFKQTVMKCRRFNKTITLPSVLLSFVFDFYITFCKYPCSPRFFGEFDMLTFTAPRFEKTLVPSSTQLTRKHPKAALKPLDRKHLGHC